MAATRLYHVSMYPNQETGDGVDHLVEAQSRSHAARFILETYGTVNIADTKLVAALCGRGYKVEVAPLPNAE